MASIYDTANVLAILAGARNPQWSTQLGHDGTPSTDADAYPSSSGAGVDLLNSVQALVAVEMRAAAHRRRSVVTVTTLDLTADYTVTIDGNACVATGAHADLDALLTELASAINASVPLDGVVTASADLTANTVTIVSDTNADYTITMSATGSGVLAVEADPTTAKLRLWATCRSSSAPATWINILDQEYDVTSRGFLERFDVAGLDRLYVEVADVDGTGDGASVTYTTPTIKVGPCVSE